MAKQMTARQIVEAYFGRLFDRAALDAFHEECTYWIAEDACLQCDQANNMNLADAVTEELNKWHTGIVNKVLSHVDEDDVIQWGDYAQVVIDDKGGIWTSNEVGDNANFDILSTNHRESLARWLASQ